MTQKRLGPEGISQCPEPRKSDRLAGSISSEYETPVRNLQAQTEGGHKSRIVSDKSRFLSVYDGRICIGFVHRRDVDSHEGFDADTKSIGTFATETAATTAVWRHAHGQRP